MDIIYTSHFINMNLIYLRLIFTSSTHLLIVAHPLPQMKYSVTMTYIFWCHVAALAGDMSGSTWWWNSVFHCSQLLWALSLRLSFN